MPLETPFILLILLAAAMHATWNSLVKAGSDVLLTQGLVLGVGALIALMALPFLPLPAPAARPFLIASMVAHFGYCIFLVLAYQRGDLSQVYPLARGMPPLVVAGMAALVVGETLQPLEIVGVSLVTLGIVSLTFSGGSPRPGRRRSLVFAAVAGLFISCYTMIDGLGVRRSGHEVSFIAWLFLVDGAPIALLAVARRGRAAVAFLRREWKPGLIGGLIATVGYSIVVWIMSKGGLARVAALRETSVILVALIGTLLLGERGRGRRIAAAALVAAGNILLNALR